VLIELVHLMGEFRDHMVVVGGWVPSLLFPEAAEPHTGSLDIDLALDFRNIPDATYQTVLKALIQRNYQQDEKNPFRFFRSVPVAGRDSILVELDLLAGEYGGTQPKHRTQKIQDARARKARGADLAFDSPVVVSLEGELPGGGRDTVTVRVASIVPWLVMKGMALADRLKEKDAYDVTYCVHNYPDGPRALAEECRPHLGNRLVREGLGKIRAAFMSVDHVGPKLVADFESSMDPDARDILKRRCYEEVTEWLDALGVDPWRS
jgi:hypothetical protein